MAAEKRKLLNEMDKCFKKVDEGVEIFEEIMQKMHEHDISQRDKFQDDLKKEIKKLQRLRDQIKAWQNSSDIKDKDKLNQYRRLIEQRMETFKDVERENKTKPHSKQGLSAEEKLDPKEKERSDTVEWLNTQIRRIQDDVDRTESKVESITSAPAAETGRKKGRAAKNDTSGDEELKRLNEHLERVKFHITNLEACLRLIMNEKLDIQDVLNKLKEPLEMFVDALDPDSQEDPETLAQLDPDYIYDELKISSYVDQLQQLGTTPNAVEKTLSINTTEDPKLPKVEGPQTPSSRRAGSSDASSAIPITAPETPKSAKVAPSPMSRVDTPPLGIVHRTHTVDSVGTPDTPRHLERNFAEVVAGTANASVPHQPAPVAPVQSNVVTPTPTPIAVAAHLPSTPAPISSSTTNVWKQRSEAAAAAAAAAAAQQQQQAVVRQQQTSAPASVLASAGTPLPPGLVGIPQQQPLAYAAVAVGPDPSLSMIPATRPTPAPSTVSDISTVSASHSTTGSVVPKAPQMVLAVSSAPKQRLPTQTARIPPTLGCSPLGPLEATQEMMHRLRMIDAAAKNLPFNHDATKNQLPRQPCATPSYFPQKTLPMNDGVEYYLKLETETLFFVFYYMEGTRAQLFAANALKRQSWRFHTHLSMWFQRHNDPIQITDEYERGSYVFFDFERWQKRRRDDFIFEYKFLEDRQTE